MAVYTEDGSEARNFGLAAREALGRRLTEIWGLCFLALGALVAAALASYDAADPSHFNATGASPQNWLGRPGAVLADPLMRALGGAAWYLALFPLAWGARFMFHAGEHRIWAQLLVAPFAILAGAAFASTHPVPAGWPVAGGLGGMIGDAAAGAALALIPLAPGPALKTLSLGLAGPALLLWGASIGVSGAEAARALAWMGRSFLAVTGRLTLLGIRLARGALAAAPRRAARAEQRPIAPTAAELRRTARPVPGPADAAPAPEATGLAAATETAAEPRTDATAEEAAPEAPAAPAARRSRWWAPPRLPGFDFAKRASEPVPDEDRVEPPLARADEGAAPGEERPLGDLMTALRTTPPPAPEGGAAAEGGDDPFLALDLEPAGPPISDPPRKTVTQPHRQPRRSRRAEEEAQPSLVFGDEGEEGAASYAPPALALLQAPDDTVRAPVSEHALEENARMLETVLEDYGVRGEIVAVKPGPVVTLYELEPAPGLKASRVIGLADDIARSMSALSARVSTMPGRSVIGIELPNDRRETVFLRELIESPEYGDSRHPLALALGKDIEGTPVVVNLAKMPHLLIAGTTGSGKSVAVNTMILSLLYRLGPQECRIIMIDPKMLELSVYDGIPHLLTPVVTDPKKAVVALKWVVAEMEERYRKMSRMGVRNIDGYNARVKAALERGERFERRVQTGFDEDTGEPVHETESFEPEPLPLIVVIVDEMADLMMVAGKEIEACIQRLAQMARASGIHLIMATQRPSVDVITGTIKANFPTRISFQVTSKIDSRTILGEQGAEQLLGQGDMLYMAGGGRIRRLHGPFVSDQEVEEVVMHLKSLGEPDYVDAVTEGGDEETQAVVDEKLGLANPGDSDDTLYDKAVAIVARDRKCSTSYVQRKLQIGYNKAARLVEQMETEGVVSPANQVGKREILIEER